jgi:hypothetical protein
MVAVRRALRRADFLAHRSANLRAAASLANASDDLLSISAIAAIIARQQSRAG